MADKQLSEAEQRRIIDAVKEKGVRLPCPRCGHSAFSVLDGVTMPALQSPRVTGFILGGATVPCAVVACNQCGYLSFHSLGVLGLMDLMGDAGG